MIELSFLPDRKRASAIDARMRNELADSLDYLKIQLQDQRSDSNITGQLEKLDQVKSTLRNNNRVRPAVFGHYYRLVFSILNNENDLHNRVDNLVTSLQVQPELTIRELSATGLGDDSLVTLYQQCLDTDENMSFGFLSPEPKNSQQMRESVYRALQLMSRILPELFEETHAIISEIILASAPKTPNSPSFDGASSYQLWGALVLNADEDKSDMEMVEILAHEEAHSLLFGLTVTEPLVYDQEGCFKSPLRQDLRPMDGIYHATFVSARMHYAMSRAIKSSLLSDSQKSECERYLLASRKAFYDGFEVISTAAELSDTGRVIMQNAHEFMEHVA